MTETEMTDYYAKRASEYERIYQKPERQEDLTQLQATLAESFGGLDLLEIACGTGYWTQFACRSARSIVATDCNKEVLDIARKKDYGDCPVTFVEADAYVLGGIDGPFSAALAGFWWSHVPKEKLGDFSKVLHSKLCVGATVIVLDNRYVEGSNNRYVEGSSTRISRTDDQGNTYQIRHLSDGSRHEVLKNFPDQDEFRKRIESVAEDFRFTTLDYFWLAQYTLTVSAEQGTPTAG